jgi:hypothetical protein
MDIFMIRASQRAMRRALEKQFFKKEEPPKKEE